MADHGLIKSIQFILEREQRPLSVAVITAMVDEHTPIPFVNKQKNIHALLAMEVHKRKPRWRRVTTGTYAALESLTLDSVAEQREEKES